MSDCKPVPALAAVALAFLALAAGNALGDPAARERYPDAKIDPAKGVEGDVGFSDTIEFWRTEAALERHAAFGRQAGRAVEAQLEAHGPRAHRPASGPHGGG